MTFTVNKTEEVSVVTSISSVSKTIQVTAPVRDVSGKKIGSLLGIKSINTPENGDTWALYKWNIHFSEVDTVIKGLLTLTFEFFNQTTNQGESEIIGTYVGAAHAFESNGDFLNQIGVATKVKDSTPIRVYSVNYPCNYSNTISKIQSPSLPNVNEYIHLSEVDTPDWTIDPKDNTKYVCQNPGAWQILTQYQMVNIIPTTSSGVEAQIAGWFNVNGVDIPNSDATGCVPNKNGKNVLAIAYNNYFNKGDYVKFGIRSISSDGNLNAVVQGYVDATGIYAPSVIISALKFA